MGMNFKGSSTISTLDVTDFFGHMTVQFASKIGVLHTEYYGRKPNSYVLEIDLNFLQGNGKTYSFSMLVKNA